VGVKGATFPLKAQYTVSNDNVLNLIQPGSSTDRLTEILRQWAPTLPAHAAEAEFTDFLSRQCGSEDGDDRQRIVRHGHLPKRKGHGLPPFCAS
jgi:putative transposase